MQIDKVKEQRQLEGVQRVIDNDYQGILAWHTGVGKTYGAVLFIKEIERIFKGTYLITVPSNTLVTQWQNKLNKLLPKNVINRIVIKSVTTILQEGVRYIVDTHIDDEIHENHTDERLKLFDGTIIESKKFLGLTASVDDKNFRKILKYHRIVDVISADEAKEKGFVADTVEYNLGVNLTKPEQERYDKYSATINEQMPKFNNDLKLAQKVISGGLASDGKHYSGLGFAWGIAVKKNWNPNLDKNIPHYKLIDDLWNPNKIVGCANALMNAVRLRRKLLCDANSKLEAVLQIANKFNNVKTILFSESTDFATKVAKVLNDNNHKTVVFHSKIQPVMMPGKTGKLIKFGATRLKNLAIESIVKGTAKFLSTVSAFDKGMDIVDIRMTVTTSGTSNTTQYTQRGGRAGRKESDSDRPVLLINVYCINTQEEKWLTDRQRNNSQQPFVVTSVDDITYYPTPNNEFTLSDL